MIAGTPHRGVREGWLPPSAIHRRKKLPAITFFFMSKYYRHFVARGPSESRRAKAKKDRRSLSSTSSLSSKKR